MTESVQPSRRALFLGKWNVSDKKPTQMKLRLPGALSEDKFLNLCIRCEDCISTCPEQVIVHGQGGFPELDFSKNGCSSCFDCITACKTGALSQSVNRESFGRAVISDACVTKQGVTCQSCRDACEPEAIKFEWKLKTNIPTITNDCTGCGYCVAVCPTTSISVIPVTQ